MSQSHCTRTWQAEAREDERLPESDRASFERHALTCSECTNEINALASLRATMLQLPALTSTPLEQRRLRTEFLRRLNEPEPEFEKGRRLPAFAFGLVAACALFLLLGRAYFSAHSAPIAVAPAQSPSVVVAHEGAPAQRRDQPRVDAPFFEIADVDHGAWQSRNENGVVRTALTAGSASFHVEHLAGGQRFLVALPDGELEVHGTRFVVMIKEGRTSHVEVTEGVVALRIAGQAERLLRAGERWPVEVATPPTKTPIPHAAEKLPPSSSAALPVPAVETPTPETAKAAARTGRFALAMDAYRAGDYARADDLFARFATDFPDDSRVEDADFLRVVARSRAGDEAGAASLSRSYLAKYPQGLRRREAEQFLRAPF